MKTVNKSIFTQSLELVVAVSLQSSLFYYSIVPATFMLLLIEYH